MKKNLFLMIGALALILGLGSCSSNETKETTETKTEAVEQKDNEENLAVEEPNEPVMDKVADEDIDEPVADEEVKEESKGDDWDAFLDEYEKYVDKYVATCKKAKNGDMSALSEYSAMAQEANKMSEKLSKGAGTMTTAQMNRYNKINTKMLNAMQ